MVYFNEAHLHEATLNLHTYELIFSHLSIASVDGKQHLSEVVFSALVRFSLYTSMHHRLKQSPESSTGMSSVIMWCCVTQETGVGDQQAVGASITTVFQHILHTLFRLFWGSPGFLLSWYGSLRLLAIPTRSSDTFLRMKNLTSALNNISLKCYLPLTDAIDRREKIHAYIWRLKVALCKHSSLKSTKFLQKKKVRYFSNRPHICFQLF